MNEEQVFARSAIEALRSGVPSRHAVDQLGTTQNQVREAFEARVEAMAAGKAVEPLVIAATFGAGKSHLLNYLKSLATNRGCVTSLVVVSPEMPLGNAHAVLKAIAESAEAPGRIGSALRALASDMHTNSPEYAKLRIWARDSGLDERFAALLYTYEELRADEEFRTQILSDFEGKPVVITLLRQKLKELGQAAGYALKAKKNSLLAHDRIRLLAQFYRTCGCKGWVVLFDELERIAFFSTKQRLAAWEELGWWQAAAREDGAVLLPVFATAAGLYESTASVDELRFRSNTLDVGGPDLDRLGAAGIELVKSPIRLTAPDADQEEHIKYRLKSIYETAYQVSAPAIDPGRNDVRTTIRSEIRRWITLWDLHRSYPNYEPALIEEDVTFDTSQIDDECVFADGEDNAIVA